MADTHQSNQYEKLVRRIGYSVGLEDLVERVNKLVDLYVKKRDISLALWKELVKDGYSRKISDDLEPVKWGGNRRSKKKLGAEDHFADVYSELNLIYHHNSQIFPLYGLEILSILRRIYTDEHKYQKALKSVILLFVLEADGDIFLNCLLGNFEKEAVKNNLIHMFETKGQTYLKAYVSPNFRNKLSSLFKVKSSRVQENLFERKVPIKDNIEIPEDYLSKILPSRKGWAIDLELFSNKVEKSGESLIAFLKTIQIVKNTYAAFYSYTEGHKMLFIDEEKAGIHSIERKRFIRDFFPSYLRKEDKPNSTPIILTEAQIYDLLFNIMTLYKDGNKSKGAIRHQLPFQVLFPVFYAVSAIDGLEYCDLEEFIKRQLHSPERKLEVLNLRGSETEGALSFRI